MWIDYITLIVLIIILIFSILIYTKQNKEMENFENCFKMQYYGIPFYNQPNNKICSENTTNPLYKEGGCAVYDQSQVQSNYYQGKYRKGV